MGSYVSLLNTTPDTWMVKIIHTTWKYSELSEVVEGLVRQINLHLRPTPQLGLTVDQTIGAPDFRKYVMSGMTAATLHRMAAVAGLASTASWASVFSAWASRYLEEEGCAQLWPGGKFTTGKHTLSLIRRGVCYRVRPDPPNPQEITVHLLLMHPIYSGPTDNSNNVYHMQDWIDNNGLNGAVRIRLDAAGLAAVQSAAPRADIAVDWLKVFAETRLEAKQKALQAEGKDSDAGIVEEGAPVSTTE